MCCPGLYKSRFLTRISQQGRLSTALIHFLCKKGMQGVAAPCLGCGQASASPVYSPLLPAKAVIRMKMVSPLKKKYRRCEKWRKTK